MKTQYIFIGSRAQISKIPNDTVIQACDAIIQPRDYAKNLGMHFDKHMLFEKHIQDISKKLFGILMYINRVRHNQ